MLATELKLIATLLGYSLDSFSSIVRVFHGKLGWWIHMEKVEEQSNNSVSFSFWRVWNWDTLLIFCFTAKWSSIYFSPLSESFYSVSRPSLPSKLTFVISWIEHSKQNSTSRRNGSKDQTVNQRFFTTKPEMNKVSKKENFTWGKNEIIFSNDNDLLLRLSK